MQSQWDPYQQKHNSTLVPKLRLSSAQMHDRIAILRKNKRKTHRNIEISSLPFWQGGPPQKCKLLIVRPPRKPKNNSPCDVLRPSKASISHLQRSRSPVDKNVHREHCQAGSTQAPEFPANDRGKPQKDLECHEMGSYKSPPIWM